MVEHRTIQGSRLYTLNDGLTPTEYADLKVKGCVRSHIFAMNTEEFRRPKKGEWYLSGAIPGGYKAHSDLDDKFFILVLVAVGKIVRYEILRRKG